MKIGIVGKSRYIDANKLIERLRHNPDFLTAPKHSKDGIIDEIVYQPTADVVEVVRCKDCKYLYCLSAVDRRFYCRHHPDGLRGINIVEDNPYCSYGERREK